MLSDFAFLKFKSNHYKTLEICTLNHYYWVLQFSSCGILKTFLFDNKSWILVIHFCVFTILDHLDKAFVVSFRHLYILNIRLRVKLGILIRSDMWKNLKGLVFSTWTHHFVISQGKTYVTVLIKESKMYKYKGVSYIMLA